MGISKYDNEYYVNKSIEKYGDRTHWREFLDEEAKENPEYNPTLPSILLPTHLNNKSTRYSLRKETTPIFPNAPPAARLN